MNRKVLMGETGDKIEYLPTSTIMITFEGVVLPRYISISYLSFPVTPYLPPVTQCYKCLIFGHTSTQCKGKKMFSMYR